MGPAVAPLIGLGIGLIGGIGKMFGRGKANREMDKLLAKNPVYNENPLARQRLGLAQTLLNLVCRLLLEKKKEREIEGGEGECG